LRTGQNRVFESLPRLKHATALLIVLVFGTGGNRFTPQVCHATDVYPLESVPFDPYTQVSAHTTPSVVPLGMDPDWCIDLCPAGLIYRPYLAGPKESRTGLQIVRSNDRWLMDSSIGGQWGLLRYGTLDTAFPKGIQLDVEGSAQLRFRRPSSLNFLTSDLRFGLPLSFSHNNHQTKLGLYFLRTNPSGDLLERIQSLRTDDFFQRKSLVLGHSVYLTNRFRLYGEAGYAFSSRVSENWEFQFGAEYAPVCPTGLMGSPFVAANGYLREEVDFGGTFTLQVGWAWRKTGGRLFRIGLHYANGKSNHLALHDRHEQQFGFGIWHDF
jgi:hypothetical protein